MGPRLQLVRLQLVRNSSGVVGRAKGTRVPYAKSWTAGTLLGTLRRGVPPFQTNVEAVTPLHCVLLTSHATTLPISNKIVGLFVNTQESGLLYISLYIGGWGEERSGPNREIVSFRSCVRAVSIAKWERASIVMLAVFPFPFVPGRLSLFPLFPGGFPFSLGPPPPNLLSNFSWVYRYI